jgi:acetate---CoA ligase (ADP-forming)
MDVPRSVEAVLRPRSIALVGASETAAAGWSKKIFDNVRHFGSTVPVYPINPRRSSVWGQRCYSSFADLPEAVDLALMILPATAIPSALREARAAGLKAATIYAAGFGEGVDHEGADLADELRELCADGLRLVGPNCMGALSVRERLYLYPAVRVRDVTPGNVALVMQSGGLFQFWLQQAAARGLGFSYAVTSGNEVDLDLADYVNFFVDDEATEVICCLAEGIRRPEAFVAAAAKALDRRKPMIVVKIGRTEAARRAAQSHTGSLAGDDRVFDAVCERYGVLRVPTLDDMIETALVVRSGRLPHDSHLAMVGYSGAARGLALDAAASENVQFAALAAETRTALQPNLDPGTSDALPLDVGAMATVDPKRYARICSILLQDPDVGLLAMQAILPAAGDSFDPQWLAAISASTDKPVFAYGFTSQNVLENGQAFQRDAGMSFVQRIPEAIRAAKQLMIYARRFARGPAAPLPVAVANASNIEDALVASGVPMPAQMLVSNVGDVVEAAERIGYPVALKLHSSKPIHKTELGGVILDLRADGVRLAAEKLFDRIEADPELACDGLLVQEMVSGLEMIVGARCDAQFGPVILLGLGGIFVEALDDIVLRLLPVTPADVRLMIAELRGKALFKAFRGQAERDVDALVAAVVAVGTAFLERRTVLEDIEINPLVVLERGRGVRAIDVRTVWRP